MWELVRHPSLSSVCSVKFLCSVRKRASISYNRFSRFLKSGRPLYSRRRRHSVHISGSGSEARRRRGVGSNSDAARVRRAHATSGGGVFLPRAHILPSPPSLPAVLSPLTHMFRWVSVLLRGVLVGRTQTAHIPEFWHLPQPGEMYRPVREGTGPVPSPIIFI